MKHPGGPLTVRAEGLEERRTVALGDAGEDRQVQLECTLACMEDPAEVMADLSCDVLDRYFAHQVQIDLGSDLGQAAGQDLRPLVREWSARSFDSVVSEKLASLPSSRTAAWEKRRLITHAWMFALSRMATAASMPLPR